MGKLTLFDLPEPVAVEAEQDPRTRQLRVMHERHGVNMQHTCGECAFLVRGQYEGRGPYYHKCQHYTPWTHGPGTDWRRFWLACGKFEAQQEKA